MHWSPARLFIRFEINVRFYCTNRNVDDSTLHCNNKGLALNCFMCILFGTCSSNSYWCIAESTNWRRCHRRRWPLCAIVNMHPASEPINIRAAILFYNEFFLAYALRGCDRWRIHYQHLTVIVHLNHTPILVCLRQLASGRVERILKTDISRYKNSRISFFHQTSCFFL